VTESVTGDPAVGDETPAAVENESAIASAGVVVCELGTWSEFVTAPTAAVTVVAIGVAAIVAARPVESEVTVFALSVPVFSANVTSTPGTPRPSAVNTVATMSSCWSVRLAAVKRMDAGALDGVVTAVVAGAVGVAAQPKSTTTNNRVRMAAAFKSFMGAPSYGNVMLAVPCVVRPSVSVTLTFTT
jgi:hypothetical protein